LYKRSFWQGFLYWIEQTLYQTSGLITEESLGFYSLIDSVNELESELASKFKHLLRI